MRVEITDDVIEQLATVLETADVDDPVNWMAVQFAAQDAGFDDLADFIYEADASTYYEALHRAAEASDEDLGVPSPS